MKIARSSLYVFAFTAAGFVGATSLHAETVEDFESYTTGQDIVGLNGWAQFDSGAGGGLVTPDNTSGFTTVLSGSKSYVISTNGEARSKPFSATAPVADGSTLSTLIRMYDDGSPGSAGLYISHNVAAFSTPGGIEVNVASGEFQLFGVAGSDSTGVTAEVDKTYLIEMELDFTNDIFDAYATNVTDGGARTFLGSKLFTTDLDASTVLSNGGVVLLQSENPAFYDAIQINPVPEPASLGLLALGGLAMLRRRRD